MSGIRIVFSKFLSIKLVIYKERWLHYPLSKPHLPPGLCINTRMIWQYSEGSRMLLLRQVRSVPPGTMGHESPLSRDNDHWSHMRHQMLHLKLVTTWVMEIFSSDIWKQRKKILFPFLWTDLSRRMWQFPWWLAGIIFITDFSWGQFILLDYLRLPARPFSAPAWFQSPLEIVLSVTPSVQIS